MNPDFSREVIPADGEQFLFGANFVPPASPDTGLHGLTTRIVYFGASQQSTVDFAKFVFPNHRCGRISDGYVADLGEREHTFDALIVCGKDPMRLRRFLRHYRPVLHSKIKIAIMPHSTPHERAGLLNSGFDDVFEEKFDPLEVKLRVAAIYRRIKVYRARREVSAMISDADRRRFFLAEPTIREAFLFNMMMSTPGQSVPTSRLCSPPGGKYTQVTQKSLQVYLAGLRKKLSHAVYLRHDGTAGYSLHLVNGREG